MINTGRRWSFIQKMVIRLAMSLGAWLNVKMNTMWLLFLSHWKIRKKAKHKPKPDSTCWYVLGYITNYLKMRWLKTVFIVTSCGFWDSGSQRQLHWLIRAQFPRSAMKRHDQTYADVSQHHGKPSCLASRNQGRASDGHIALSAPAQEYRSVHPQVWFRFVFLIIALFSRVVKPARRPVWWGTSSLQPLSHFYELQLNPRKGGESP